MILLDSTLLTGCGITRELFKSISMANVGGRHFLTQAAGRMLSIGAIVRCFSFPSSLFCRVNALLRLRR